MTVFTEQQWLRIKLTLNTVIDASPPQRDQALHEACDGDQWLQDHVRRLLHHHDAGDSFLRSDGPWPATLPDGEELIAAMLPADRRIGRYVVGELIGRGSIGLVFRARQDEPSRDVAMKILHPAITSMSVALRFRQEIRALARLQHQSIAAIHEAGTFDSPLGTLSYLTIELVDGMPITQWVKSRTLTTAQTIRVFLEVCDAIEHAHQRGVVHLDLKPANIFMDHEGRTKVLDFGIARLMDERKPAPTAGRRGPVGTPPYMSPEQISGEADIDVRCDVYALGVIGYELFCGQSPYDMNGAEPIARDAPSVRLSAVGRRYRGDLETILARALQHDRTLRYQSVSELSGDMRRVLNDEPVLARQRRASYVVGKFCRRRRAVVVGVAAALLALAAGLVGTTREARRADRERIAARREADKANAINDYVLSRMLAAANPWQKGPDVKVVEVLREASRQAEDAFAAHPEVGAAVLDTIGVTFFHLGSYSEAEQCLQQAHELRTRLLGSEHLETISSQEHLAHVWLVTNRAAEAEKAQRHALQVRQRETGANDRRALAAQVQLARCLGELQRFGESETLMRQALEGYRATLGPTDAATIQTMSEVGRLRLWRGDATEAKAILAEAADLARNNFGPSRPETIDAEHRVLECLVQTWQTTEAEALARDMLARCEAAFGPEHPRTLSVTQSLGQILKDQARFTEAEPYYRKALDIQVAKLGPSQEDTILTMNSLALLLKDLKQLDDAEDMARQSLDRRLEVVSGDDTVALMVHNTLGMIHYARHRYEDAEHHLRTCYEGYVRIYGGDDLKTARVAGNLSESLRQLGRLAEARPLAEQAANVSVRELGNDSYATLGSRMTLAALLLQLGDVSAAEQVYQAMLTVPLNANRAEKFAWGAIRCDYGKLLITARRFDEAQEQLRQSYERMKTLLGPEHQASQQVLQTFIRLYDEWPMPDKAAEHRRMLEEAASRSASDRQGA